MYRKRSWRETLRTRTLPGWIPVCAGWLRIITVRAEPMAMSAVSTRRPLVHPSACGGPRPRLCVLVVVVDPRARGVACGLTTWCGHRVGTSSRVRGRPKVSSVLGSSPCVRRGRLQIRDDLEDLGFIPARGVGFVDGAISLQDAGTSPPRRRRCLGAYWPTARAAARAPSAAPSASPSHAASAVMVAPAAAALAA